MDNNEEEKEEYQGWKEIIPILIKSIIYMSIILSPILYYYYKHIAK